MPKMVAVLLVASMLSQAEDSKPAVSRLVSSDRMVRHKAAEALLKLPGVPESALPNIIQYLKLEVAQAMVPDTRPVRGEVETIDRLPVTGDELSLARLKAGGDQYVEKPFILTGAIRIDDYYNFGFRSAQDTHYSFRLEMAAKNGELDGSVPIYMSRFRGSALAEQITREQERVPNSMLAIRLECVVHRNRIQGDISNITNTIEATDWQVLAEGNKSWMPWTFEAIGLGYSLMSKVGKASMMPCVDMITSDQEFQGEKADTMLKGNAIGYMLGLPAKDRTLIFRRLSLRAKKVKGKAAKEWTRRLYFSLEAGRLVL
jgi:hypothetical protein